LHYHFIEQDGPATADQKGVEGIALRESIVSLLVLLLAIFASLLLTPQAWILASTLAAISIALAGAAIVRGKATKLAWLGNGALIVTNLALIAIVLPIW
jgi:hypothetical protein